MNDWKNIWDSKKMDKINLNRSEFDVFCDLKRIDGFDVNVKNDYEYFKAFYEEWQGLNKMLNELTNNEFESVYEVGCGSGVNLYMFQNRIENLKAGGIDYSSNLINIAKNVVGSDDLICGDAGSIDDNKKYDVVMADSVFQYFESLTYSECVLRKMISKANKVVYLGELHNEELSEQWLEHRRASMENYDDKYAKLPKLFYSKNWLENIVDEYHKKIIYTTSNNAEYWNSKYIFNCYIY
ncbi:MAG: class I SAM-dependent methyltransferase [Lachnospiraceae bacterium]|nr:class I SAM-dependent methyltransferase [Lachnospiraceae bacterium]